VRVTLALLAAALGGVSLSDSLANVLERPAPAQAHTLAPWDGTITAALAQRSFTARPSASDQSEPAQLARKALLQDATAVDALTVLALQAQLRNDSEEARRIFSHSLTLSRRELRPRLWAIEEAVLRGDIRGALANYDMALRTSRTAPDLLFPVLASALSEQKVRSALLEILADAPPWGEDFLQFATRSGVDPLAAARLLREPGAAGLPVEDGDRTAVTNLLVSRNLFAEAWDFYSSYRKGAERGRSRDPDFTLAIDQPAAFDWNAISLEGISSSIQRSGGGGLADFSVPPSVGGPVLQQTQMLPAGGYRLQGNSVGIDQPERSRPYWQLTCADGRELGRLTLPNSSERGGEFSGPFTVPANCPVQLLALVARASDAISGISGQIDNVLLAPED
jgi:hypothetical protein